jgi:DNA-binding NtrC family response regulator
MSRALDDGAEVVPMHEALRRFERLYLAEALRRAKTVTAAARLAGVNRWTFHRIAKRCGFALPQQRRGNWSMQGL